MWKFLSRRTSKDLKPGHPKRKSTGANQSGKPEQYTIRDEKLTKADKVFLAWTSGDLSKMVAALNQKTNPIDRHYLLLNTVEQAYKQRKANPDMRALCIRVSKVHIQEFGELSRALQKSTNGLLPRVPTFQYYATVLVEAGEFDQAIDVCQMALSFNLGDGTQSGFKGRIERIKNKASKS